MSSAAAWHRKSSLSRRVIEPFRDPSVSCCGNTMPSIEPVYLQSHRNGVLRRKAEQAFERLAACTLCPRRCGVDRLAGETGACKTGRLASVSSFNAHFGEEAPLVGKQGSGT